MAVSIERVESPAQFRTLHVLLVEYEHDLPPDLRHGDEPRFEDVERTYRGGNAAFLARTGERYGGCVVVCEFDAESAILQRLYVKPESRGQGAARALARAAVDFARERGFARIVLDTQAERLSAAAALYRSMGFTECPPFGEVDYEHATFMELQLRTPSS